MLTGHLGEQLNSWMSAVSADGLRHLHRFVRGLDVDHAAVLNSLTPPYSSGDRDPALIVSVNQSRRERP
ncbi:hypothetical protein XU06_29440 (plasmid) [Rhodococcus erythropolis]|nr:hypothetical protein XU06_29440 [Rhodococcus erythropolis]